MLRLRFALAISGLNSPVFSTALILGCLCILILSPDLIAQQQRQTQSGLKEMAGTEDKPFEDQFWKYLIGNNYKNWSPGPGQNGDFYMGQNPHGALLKMYLNRAAAGRTQNFPMGSVIILENYRADKSLKTISVMYRTDGFNPQGNDWYWVDYHPDGTVVKAPVTSEAKVNNVSLNDGAGHLQKTMGRATNCMACHQGGEGLDFVFFNDKALDGRSPMSPEERFADKTPLIEAR